VIPLCDAMLRPVPFGASDAIDFPLNGQDVVMTMLDAIDAVTDVFPTPASKAIRVGTHGFDTRVRGSDRVLSLHEDADGDVVAGLRLSRTSSNPYTVIRLVRASEAPEAARMSVLPVSADDVDVIDNLRRFGSFVRAHLPNALDAVHRSRMGKTENDLPAAIRLRTRMIAQLLSQETDGPVVCDATSPLSPLRIRPNSGAGTRFSFHEDLITEERLKAWSTVPCLQIGMRRRANLEGAHELEISAICESADARGMDPLSVMRAIEGLPQP
jgi:hypothetical protein